MSGTRRAAGWGAALGLGLALVAPAARAGEDAQRVLLAVRFAEPGMAEGVRVVLDRLGERRELLLRDDGGEPGDQPGDGVWVGWDEGPPARWVTVRLDLLRWGTWQEVYLGTENLAGMDRAALGWRVGLERGVVRAWRESLVWPGSAVPPSGSFAAVVAFGWCALVGLWVGWVAWREAA